MLACHAGAPGSIPGWCILIVTLLDFGDFNCLILQILVILIVTLLDYLLTATGISARYLT